MYKPFRALFLFSSLLLGTQIQAQQLTNSPYSRFGLGDVSHGTGSIRNAGMGQVGVAAFNVSGALYNDINPALTFYNPSVTFEAAVNSELKKLSDGSNSQLDGTANLGYLAISIPISKRWVASVGLRPYSRVNYTTFLSNQVAGGGAVTTFTEYKGEGGINEVFFSHGVRIASGFTVGATGSYLFGNISSSGSTVLVDANDPGYALQKTLITNTTKYSGFLIKGATHYRKKLASKLYLGLGATYDVQSAISADRQVSQERRYLDESLISRTVTDSTEGYSTIPQTMQFGLGLDNARNFSVGADYSRIKSSEFRGYSRDKNAGAQELGDGYRIGLGGEFTPDPGSVTSYFDRVIYRVGGYHSSADVATSTGMHTLTNTAVTWGFSFPVGRGARPPDYTQGLLSTSFALGVQEAKETGLKEKFFRFSLGVTFNNRWFIKRRFD